MIIRKLELGPFAANCYIVGSESTKEGMIIDPGTMPDEILKHVDELDLKIKVIVLTHAHVDHVSALAAVKEATGADVAIHTDDVPLLRGGDSLAMLGLSQKGLPEPDRVLEEGDVIDIGDLHFSILHTPGHTPGGLCLYAEGQLFTGDTLFVGDSGRTDLQGGDRPALGASIRSLMKLPDDTIVWPGHDYGDTASSTIGHEKRTNVNAKEYGYYVKD